MIESHLLALLVIVPLLASPICLLLPNGRGPWLLTTAVAWVVFAIAIALVLAVGRAEAGFIAYWMGDWEPPWGIEYRLDSLNALIVLIIASIGAVVLPFARDSVPAEVERGGVAGFYTAFLLAQCGLLGIAVTGDVFNLFVFLEISSLASYILISQSANRRALVAAYQYLIVGTLGATFLLIGIGLLWAMTGTLNMADLAVRLPEVEHTRAVYTGFAFIMVGAAIKLALFPLHLWMPNAYTYAPSMVSAFLAATATKVGVYVMLRFAFTVFGQEFTFGELPFALSLGVLAVAAILVGSVTAILQVNAKRLLAYSSVAQIGYMVLGVCTLTVTGLTAANLHLFNHALMKGALFLALGCVMFRAGGVKLGDLQGMGRRMPWTMAAFVIGGLSLVGVPLTAGFVSKWYLVLAAVELGWWPVVVVVVVGSLLGAVYIWRVIEVAYFQEGESRERCEAPLSLLVPTWVLALSNIYFGIDTRLPVHLAEQAALRLLGGLL